MGLLPRTLPPLITLYAFARPDEPSLQRVRELLRQLDTTGWESPRALGRAQSEAAMIGGLELVMRKLAETLTKDAEEMEEFQQEVSTEFEYLVEQPEEHTALVAINTRMFHLDRRGSIRYGRAIARVGEDEYALWIDD